MKIALTLTKREITTAVNNKYLEYVHNAGLQPICFDQLTPPEVAMEMSDGLLLKGGSDIDPIFYGYNNISSLDIDPEMDEFERRMFWSFYDAQKPIFGICRGFQLIFREMEQWLTEDARINGLLYVQHMDGHNQARKDVKRPYAFHYVRHDDKLYDLRADGAEKRALAVNSMHHQGVQKHTGKGHKKYNQATSPIIPIAWSSNILEAFCSVNHNVLAVQWHPEEMNDIRLLQNIFGQREEEQEEEIEGL